MDATSQEGKATKYLTPPRVQAWFLGRSREKWKRKYKNLKADAKRLQNRVNDVTRSRENWPSTIRESQVRGCQKAASRVVNAHRRFSQLNPRKTRQLSVT